MYISHNMILVPPTDAWRCHLAKIPWRVRLSFAGLTGKGNASFKYWSMYSLGDPNPVYTTWGNLGQPQLNRQTSATNRFSDAVKIMNQKLQKGYRVDSRDLRKSNVELGSNQFLSEAWAVVTDFDGGLLLVDQGQRILMKLTLEGAKEALSDPFILSHSQGCHLVREGNP